jgi:hypothetical protein
MMPVAATATVYTITPFIRMARNRTAEFYWLLDINFNGTIRIADAPLIIPVDKDLTDSVYAMTGIPYIYYQEGLSVSEYVDTNIDLNIWSRAGRTIKANISVTGHHQLQNLDELFGLAGVRAELSLWAKGTYWEERYIVL